MIWDVQISGHLKRTGSVEISRKPNDTISINPSLVRLIKRNFAPDFYPQNFQNGEVDFNLILDILNTILILLGSTPLDEYFPFYPLDYFQKEGAKFFVDPIPSFLEADDEFTHQVIFTFDAEDNQQLVYSWFVNIENGVISPIDDNTKNIQQTVDYSD